MLLIEFINKYRRVLIISTLCALVMCWGGWVLFKQRIESHPAELNYEDHLQEVVRAHENYSARLNVDTCTILIYRYSFAMCSPCYQEDMYELYEFSKTIDRNKVLTLPAYSSNDRYSLMRIKSEIKNFNYRNIPADSLVFPKRNGEEMRYFAVIDKHGQKRVASHLERFGEVNLYLRSIFHPFCFSRES